MSTLHLTDEDLILHYYGELDDRGETRVGSHLGACASCQASYSRLQRVLAFVDSVPAPDAPAGFERTAWARLEPALPTRERSWLPSFVFSPARLAWAAAIVVLLTGAFFAGRLLPRSEPAAGPQQATGAAQEKVRERILLVDLGDHLDRSQMVLVELVSAGEDASVDISSEQARAQQLLAANRLYRQTALSTGNTAMADVLDELERVLVDIAASPSTMTQQDLESVRRRIASKELLFKVRVVSTQVRERQKAAIQERATQSLGTTKS
jgi:anti-sigma factor RsiW